MCVCVHARGCVCIHTKLFGNYQTYPGSQDLLWLLDICLSRPAPFQWPGPLGSVSAGLLDPLALSLVKVTHQPEIAAWEERKTIFPRVPSLLDQRFAMTQIEWSSHKVASSSFTSRLFGGHRSLLFSFFFKPPGASLFAVDFLYLYLHICKHCLC